MIRRLVMIALASGSAGCAPEASSEPAELAELCGVAGPVELFPLEPDHAVSSRLLELAGRYVYTTGRLEGESIVLRDYEVWSVGECGQSPRRIAEDVNYVHTSERWPGVLFGCNAGGDIVTLDPAGEQPPHVVFTQVDCARPSADATAFVTLVGEKDGPRALVSHPLPEDPRAETPEPRVLLDMSLTPEYPLTKQSQLVVVGDLAFVLTTDGALLRVDVTDGAVAVEQTNVRRFLLSRDGRYLLYQDLDTPGGFSVSEGVVVLRDRMTGTGLTLAVAELKPGMASLAGVDAGFFTVTLPDEVQRVYFLPALDFVDLPRSLSLRWWLEDGRALLQQGSGGALYVTDLRDLGSTRQIFGDGMLLAVAPEGPVVLDVPPFTADGGGSSFDEGAVWQVPLDGQTPVRLADRASRSARFLADGRIVTVRDLDDEGLGELVVVEPRTREDLRIEAHVSGDWTHVWYAADSDVFYTVIDDGRASVWRARLAPR